MLEIKNLTVCFKLKEGPITALEQLSMTIHDGESVCVVGESGSGKSVLMQAVLGLLPPNSKVSGQILLDGEDLLKKNKKELESIRGVRMSYVPQGSGNSLNPLMKLGAQVGESLVEHRMATKKEAAHISVGLMRRFGLGEEEKLAQTYPHTLSGGMKQRVLLALGIAPKAPLLIADEPTKGLDSDRVELVESCFRELGECTLLCVTHDLNFAQSISQKIAMIYAGQLVEYSKAESFFEHPTHPYSRALLEAMPERGFVATEGFSPGHEDYTQTCRFYPRCGCRLDRCKNGAPIVTDGEKMVRCCHGFA